MAELTATIIVVPVETSNARTQFENENFSSDCLKHVIAQYSIDEERALFAGDGGGAARAFKNAHTYKSGGVISFSGYIPKGYLPSKRYH